VMVPAEILDPEPGCHIDKRACVLLGYGGEGGILLPVVMT
jgi:hypothetical protein